MTFLTATVLLLAFTIGNFLVETVLDPLGIAQPGSLSDWLALSGRIRGVLDWVAVKKVAAAAIQTGVSSHWVMLLAKNVVRSPRLVLLFIASFAMTYAVDLKLDRAYSSAWFSVRNRLLAALHPPSLDAVIEEALRTATVRSLDADHQQ